MGSSETHSDDVLFGNVTKSKKAGGVRVMERDGKLRVVGNRTDGLFKRFSDANNEDARASAPRNGPDENHFQRVLRRVQKDREAPRSPTQVGRTSPHSKGKKKLSRVKVLFK